MVEENDNPNFSLAKSFLDKNEINNFLSVVDNEMLNQGAEAFLAVKLNAESRGLVKRLLLSEADLRKANNLINTQNVSGIKKWLVLHGTFNLDDQYWNVAICYFKILRDFGKVTMLCKIMELLHSQNPIAWINLSRFCGLNGDYTRARYCAEKSLDIDPGNLKYKEIYIEALLLGKKFSTIKQFCLKYSFEALTYSSHIKLAVSFAETGEFSRALSLAEKLEIEDLSVNETIELSIFYRNLHRDAKALELVNKALKIDQKNIFAIELLIDLCPEMMGNEEVFSIIQEQTTGPATNIGKIKSNFLAARYFESIGDYDRAFNYYLSANKLKSFAINFDTKAEARSFKWIASYTKSFSEYARCQKKLIFIVGLPRCGSTLLEQVLLRSSFIETMGECDYFEEGLIATNHKVTFPLSSKKIDEVRAHYLGSYIADDESIYLIDKMPLNFRFIGPILQCFPNAKIINLNRCCYSNCWSLFKTDFAGYGNSFAYNLDNIVHFHNLYLEIMYKWKSVFGTRILNISYDNLTNNLSKTVYELEQFLGIPTIDKPENFYKNNRFVTTASVSQVKRSIYKNSDQAWKKYKGHLQRHFKDLIDIRGQNIF